MEKEHFSQGEILFSRLRPDWPAWNKDISPAPPIHPAPSTVAFAMENPGYFKYVSTDNWRIIYTSNLNLSQTENYKKMFKQEIFCKQPFYIHNFLNIRELNDGIKTEKYITNADSSSKNQVILFRSLTWYY